MLKRKMERVLLGWKNTKAPKNCLLIKGARQVGKTFIVERFGESQYKSFIHMNFDKNESLKDIFAGDLDIDTLKKQILLNIPTAKLIDGETLIFLDEIQHCPRARTALKFFSLDGRFDVIASGSLLGVKYKEVPSYPTGYEDEITMHSLDFEEFLWANGVSNEAIQGVKGYFDEKKQIPEAMHKKLMGFLREYIVIGGMPAVVREFVSTSDFNKALKTQKGILQNYENDIAKYAEARDKVKARACYLSLPRQLAKENSKFQYSVVEKGGAGRKFESSIDWLKDAGLVLMCDNLSLPQSPLKSFVKAGFFKLYSHDIGLLVAMLEDGVQKEIIDDKLGTGKGAIYENLIASMLFRQGKELYYYSDTDRLEVDFVVRVEGKVTGIEVKAGRGRASSLKTAMAENEGLFGIKLTNGNIGTADNIITYPLYMAMFL
ncbi:MAG: AAA family ATPase [Firmicutes bacterium]|nr:AAA family ATPase [Bacillota bacterium]